MDPQELFDLSFHLPLLLLLSESLEQLQLFEVPRSLIRSQRLKSEDSEKLLLLHLLLVGERLLLVLLLVSSSSSSTSISSTHSHAHLHPSSSVSSPLHPSTSSHLLPSRHHSSSVPSVVTSVSSSSLLLTLVRILSGVQSSHLGDHFLVPASTEEYEEEERHQLRSRDERGRGRREGRTHSSSSSKEGPRVCSDEGNRCRC